MEKNEYKKISHSGSRGQAAIEFIFLILVVVVYITSVTMPLIAQTKNTVTDTANISVANNETKKLANLVQELVLSGAGSKNTFELIVPEDTTIVCYDTNFKFETILRQKPFPAQCTANATKTSATCEKEFPITGATIDCVRKSFVGPTKMEIEITKTADTIISFTTLGG